MKKFTYIFLGSCALIIAASVMYANFFTDIYNSARAGNTLRLQKLIKSKTPNDFELNKAFHCALANNRLDTVKMLIRTFNVKINDVSDGFESPLVTASRAGYNEIVKFLIENGADVNKATDQGETPLSVAISNMKFDTAGLLVENGASVESYDNLVLGPQNDKLIRKHNEFVRLCLKRSVNLLNGNFGS
ncbi:MAG TPA: ankyrin repeat domain-containing protein, partial [Clostridia bacterium]